MRIIFRLITHGETWIYHYNLESQPQSKVWENTTWEVQAKTSAGTVMASVWWDSQGMIKKDCFEYGKTITGNTYG